MQSAVAITYMNVFTIELKVKEIISCINHAKTEKYNNKNERKHVIIVLVPVLGLVWTYGPTF